MVETGRAWCYKLRGTDTTGAGAGVETDGKKAAHTAFPGYAPKNDKRKIADSKTWSQNKKKKIPHCRAGEGGSVCNLRMLGVTVSSSLQSQSLSGKLVAGQENSWTLMDQLPWYSKEIHSQAMWKMRTDTWGWFLISTYACTQMQI